MSRILEAKKLVSVLATSMSMISPKNEALKHISCIHYPIQFKTKMTEIWVLIYSRSEINEMALAYTKKLGL